MHLMLTTAVMFAGAICWYYIGRRSGWRLGVMEGHLASQYAHGRKGEIPPIVKPALQVIDEFEANVAWGMALAEPQEDGDQ